MGICFVSLIWTVLYLPELTGRSLEEVDELFEHRPKLWGWQFDKIVTTGAGSRITRLEQGKDIEKPNCGSSGREGRGQGIKGT